MMNTPLKPIHTNVNVNVNAATDPVTKAKANSAGATKVVTSMAFIVSLVVHLVIFLFVGSIVIFEGALPPNLFNSGGGEMVMDESAAEMELPPLMEEELEPELLETPMDELQMETDIDISDMMDSSDLIVSNAAAAPTFSQPKISIGTSSGSQLRAGATSESSKSPMSARTATIFGRNVSASNFGAILDISFSTHKSIDRAVDEINNGFPDAILMLAPGCGMKKAETGQVIEGKAFEDDIKDYYLNKSHYKQKTAYTASFFDFLMNGNKNFKRMWSRVVADNRGHVVFLDLKVTKSDNLGNAGMKGPWRVSGTHHAFEFLIEQGCDAIYWMADFNDEIERDIANDLILKMKSNGVKLIQHDFNGRDDKDKDSRSIIAKMVKETDGESIISKK